MCPVLLNARMSSPANSPDIFIIGGGPAGLATAILAAQRGLRVAVADHDHFPVDKACGEGLMPDTLAAIGRLGITVSRSEAGPFRGIRFHGADRMTSVEAEFAQGFGLGIRRTGFPTKLVQRTAALGLALLLAPRVPLAGRGHVFLECDAR